MTTGVLSEMTIQQVRTFDPQIVVVGFGSTEPHGPMLPYGTDYYQCDAIVRRGVELANASGCRALMYPTLPVGNNANCKGFPLACRIGPMTLMHVALDIIDSLQEDGLRRIVLYNGHGGNADALRAALREHEHRAAPGQDAALVCMTSYPRLGPDMVEHPSGHGGEMETSMMLAVRGELVRQDQAGVFPMGKLRYPSLEEPQNYFVRPWHEYLPASAGGDVRTASADKGRRIIEYSAQVLSRLLSEFSQATRGQLFSFKQDQP